MAGSLLRATRSQNTQRHMTILKKLTLALGMVGASALSAATINFDAASSWVPNGAGYSFTATGGSVIKTNKSGLSYVGVTSGGAGNEIDYGQELLLSFNQSMTVHSLSLGLLFNGPEYGDSMESAIATTSAGTYRLHVANEGMATWSVWQDSAWTWVQDIWTPVSNTSQGGPGLFTINDPFQGAMVSSINFSTDQMLSDYGVVRVHASSTSVPDHASTLVLLGLALLGISAASRRSLQRA